MDSYQWTSYIKRVISKTEENSILRKFIDGINNRQELSVFYQKDDEFLPNNNSEAHKHSISSIASSNSSKKRVKLNLSDNQTCDNDSHSYLTPVLNQRFLYAAKTYNLPESKKPEIVQIKPINRCVNVDQFDNKNVLILQKNQPQFDNDDLKENKSFIKILSSTKKSQFPSHFSINDNDLNLNETKDNNLLEIRKETENQINKACNDETFTVDEVKTPIKSILKTSKQSISETSMDKTYSSTNRSINEKFVVNLYESRASKRWKKDKNQINDNDNMNSSVIDMKDKPQLIDLSLNQSSSSRINNNFNLNPVENTSLLNVISTNVICDMIKDIKLNVGKNSDESLFKNVFGSIQKVDECLDKTYSMDDLFTMYKRETDIQCQIMIETTKILRKCRKSKCYYGSTAHIEAEKVLLFASIKHNKITEKALQNQYEYLDTKILASGTVTLNNLQFRVNGDVKTKLPNWYVCVVSSADQLLISKVVSPKNNCISIEEDFTFDHLDWNFEIAVNLYCLDLPKYRKNKNSFFMKKQPDYVLKTLRYKDLKTNTITENYITNSCFNLCANSTILMKNIKDGQILPLNQKTSWLEENLFLNIQLKDVTFQIRWAGFLTIGKDRIGYIVWNRRWCVVDGYIMKFYNYPTDEDFSHPIECINLKNILCPYVIQANRKICSRPRTVLLHIGKTRRRHKYYISADTNEELKEFKNITEDIISYLKNWKLQTYSDELNN